ncbi:peptidase S8/S53 domain-containing protein [Aspergillus venezuelensis]
MALTLTSCLRRGILRLSGDVAFARRHTIQISRGHGTLMAQQIYRVCPKAKSLALKLKDRDDQETKKRCITPLSAAKAIKYAIQWNVHVISMSWTIRYPGPQRQSGPEFKERAAAVQEAQSKYILLFCSARDQGQDNAPTYPAFKAGAIFKIGGADIDGNLHTQVGVEDKVDFIFPGDTMSSDDIKGTLSQGQWFTGSSVATAFAAGLAALILYCAQVRIAMVAKSPREKELCTAAFKTLKEHNGMETAFNAIGKSKKYLPVWEVFDRSLISRNGMDELDLVASIPVILYPNIYSSASS